MISYNSRFLVLFLVLGVDFSVESCLLGLEQRA